MLERSLMAGRTIGERVRNYSRALRALALLPLLWAIPTPAVSQKAVWCGKTIGLLERNYTYRNSLEARDLAKSIVATGKPFLFVARTTSAAQVRALAGGMLPLLVQKGEKQPTIEEIEASLLDPTLAQAVEQLASSARQSPAEPNWYFYSNSPLFADYFHSRGMDIDAGKGALLQMDSQGEATLLRGAIEELASAVGAEAVLLDGPAPTDITFENGRRAPLVVKLNQVPARAPGVVSRANMVARLRNSAPREVAIIFLMPEAIEDALPWGFGEERADHYATNGRRILRDLANYGLSGAVVKARTADEVSYAVQDAIAIGRKLILMVGESNDGGNSVRLPGSADVVRSEDVPKIPADVTVAGLVCNSAVLLSNTPGLSIVGTVFTDQIRGMLRVFLDHRRQDSMGEYFDIPLNRDLEAAPSASDLVATLAPNLAIPAPRPVEHEQLPLLFLLNNPVTASTPAPAVASPDSSEPTRDRPWPQIFLIGFIGAVTREFFRWKRLTSKRRADLFRKPRYLAISAIQMLLGGTAAAIFSPVVALKWQYPVAFVCGAGLEELIRRASRLEIWTPAVPHGDAAEPDDSVLEYLRS